MIVIGPYREHGVQDHMCGGVRKVSTMFHGNPTTPMVAAARARGIGRTHLRMAVGRSTIGMTVAICSASSSTIA
jgi:hypothetical protein